MSRAWAWSGDTQLGTALRGEVSQLGASCSVPQSTPLPLPAA